MYEPLWFSFAYKNDIVETGEPGSAPPPRYAVNFKRDGIFFMKL